MKQFYLYAILVFSFLLLLINNQQVCELSGQLSCTNTSLCPNNTQIIITYPNTSYSCPQKTLNLTSQMLNIQGSFSSLNLTGQDIYVSNVNAAVNLTIFHQNYVQFSGYIISGNELTVDVYNSSNPNSNKTSLLFNFTLISAKRMIFQTFGSINVVNSTLNTHGTVCLYHSIHLEEYSKSIQSGNFTNITSLMQLGVTIGFLNFGSLNLTQSQFQTSIFIILTQQNIYFNFTNVNTTAKACRTNKGAGRGLVVQIKNDFCSSGSAGAGYGLTSDATCSSILQYFMFLTHSFPYMNKGSVLSTGSGGYGYNNFINNKNGAGGGIVYIFSKQTIMVDNTSIQASGGDVMQNDSLSGGSGGTVYIYSQYLGGNQTLISAFGGSSYNNKGGGSGGMVKISYQKLQKEHKGIIYINVSQGYQPTMPQMSLAANGIFYGTLCPPGKVRWYLGCQTCSQNTYNMIGNEYCLKCPRSNQFQWDRSSTGVQNPWDCFESNMISPYFLWIVPGQIDLISISCYVGLLIVFVILGTIVRKQIKKIKDKNQDIQSDFQALRKQMKEQKILTEKLKSQKSIRPYELMYHIHRITVAGSNTYLCPWVLPLMPPQVVKKHVLIDAFQNFAKKFNKLSQWTNFEVFLIKLLYLIYPLHWYYYDMVKKRKYRKLCKLLEESREYNLINNFEFEDKDLITLKFSKNKDYTSCYIDFFFYQKADLSYYNLSVPFIIYLSGQGNFIRPFYIQQNDPFVKAMNFIVNRSTYSSQKQSRFFNPYSQEQNNDKQKLLLNLVNLNLRKNNQNQLKKFVINFNAISCTLDLSAPINVFIKTLSFLIDFINNWNKKFFNKVKVQVDLILMISDLHEENIVSSSIHILSNKNQQFLGKVKAIIPKMNLNNEIDLKIGLFIYNPEQQIDKKQIKQLPRVRETLLSGQIGQSQEDYDNQISEHLLEDQIYKIQSERRMLSYSTIYSKMTRCLCLFRYFMLSHQITSKDRYTIKIMQSFLILTQTVLVFVWSIKIEIPYFFVNLVAPFIGIIWIVSDSYGFGKLFLIFNAMNLLNQIATLLIYSLAERSYHTNMVKIIICQAINLVLVVLNMIVGSRLITFSKKLKNVQ